MGPREVRDVCTGAHGEAAYNETPNPAQSLVVSLITPLLDQTDATGSMFKGMFLSSILPAKVPERRKQGKSENNFFQR